MAPAATQLVLFSPPPSAVIAGQPFGLTIAAEDAGGIVDTTYSGNVTLAPANTPSEGSLGGTLNLAFSDGLAGFTGLTIDTANVHYDIQASSAGLSPLAQPVSLGVTAETATQLVLTAQPPSTVAAGSNFGLTVSAEDQFGNVDPNFGNEAVANLNNPGGVILGGNLNLPMTEGVVTYSGLTIDNAGIGYTLQVSSSGLTSVSTSAFSVTALNATRLVVTSQPPSTLIAGAGFGLTVSPEDPYGNVDPTFTGDVAVALASGPAGDILTGTNTVTVVDGAATFSGLILNEVGTGYTLLATTSPISGLLDSTTTVAFAATQATQLVVTFQVPTVADGKPFGLIVAAEDTFGNVDPNFTGNVTIVQESGPSGGSLGGTTYVQAVNGVATFPC